MHPILYLVLIAGSALAHYRGLYDTRNLVERDEPESNMERYELVECPVCENSSTWLSINEECPIVSGGKTYKVCQHGSYNNEVCGNRRDCFRGPKDRCTEKLINDRFGQRCAPGYYCNPTMGVCTGPNYSVDSNLLWYVNPNRRYKFTLPDRSESLQNPIRARRAI